MWILFDFEIENVVQKLILKFPYKDGGIPYLRINHLMVLKSF